MQRLRWCRHDFSSVELFDQHRVGDHALDYPEHEDGRRCLDVEEMQARGWIRDAKARWTDPARLERAREAFSALGSPTESPAEAEAEAA